MILICLKCSSEGRTGEKNSKTTREAETEITARTAARHGGEKMRDRQDIVFHLQSSVTQSMQPLCGDTLQTRHTPHTPHTLV